MFRMSHEVLIQNIPGALCTLHSRDSQEITALLKAPLQALAQLLNKTREPRKHM